MIFSYSAIYSAEAFNAGNILKIWQQCSKLFLGRPLVISDGLIHGGIPKAKVLSIIPFALPAASALNKSKWFLSLSI